MRLLYRIPDSVLEPLGIGSDEIMYSAPLDLTLDGTYVKKSYALVTKESVVILYAGQPPVVKKLSELEDISIDTKVGGGIIVLKEHGRCAAVARVSAHHLLRYFYIIKAAVMLKDNHQAAVKSKERETVCDKCGHALPGTNECPRCNGRFQSFRKIFGLVRPYKWQFALVFLLMAVNAAMLLVQQVIQKNFINEKLVSQNGSMGDIAVFVAIFGLLSFGVILTTVAKNVLSIQLGSKVSMNLREQLYIHIQRLSLGFLSRRQTGELMNRIVSDTSHIREFMENAFSGMFSVIITMCGALTFMLIMDPLLTLITVIFLPVVLVLIRIWNKRIRRIFKTQSRKSDRLNNGLQDTLMGIRVVKSFGTETREAARFDALNEEVAAVTVRNEVFWATFFPILTFIMGIGLFFATYFGGMNVLSDKFLVGDLTQFLAYAGMLYGPLGWIAHLPRAIIRLTNSVERAYDILDEQPDIGNSDGALEKSLDGHIEFDNVTFGYKPNEPVLKNVSFSANPGEMIGIVGASGTGKTTLINLIMRLYDVNDGVIRADGTDIRDMNVESLHSHIGVVLQETFLFAGTILDNIRFACPGATLEQIIDAAKTANAHDFILKCPGGYNTRVGEHGYTLSGGERQRIAIARAVLGNPKILILDEATSNLDTDSESLIQEALSRLIEGRTTFAIAHRLSTLRNATHLIVIDNHEIAEQGTHSELIARKGIYYNLVVAQLQMHSAGKEQEYEG